MVAQTNPQRTLFCQNNNFSSESMLHVNLSFVWEGCVATQSPLHPPPPPLQDSWSTVTAMADLCQFRFARVVHWCSCMQSDNIGSQKEYKFYRDA